MPYPQESKHPPSALAPAEEIRDENDNIEPGLPMFKQPEPPSEKEIEETLKPARDDGDKMAKFVKWLTTDSKKEETKKNEPAYATTTDSQAASTAETRQTATQPVNPDTSESHESSLPARSAAISKSPGLEIIPPISVREKSKLASNPNLVVYPSVLPPVVKGDNEIQQQPGLKKDESRAGGFVKWLLTDPKKEVAKKKEADVVKAETQPAPTPAPTDQDYVPIDHVPGQGTGSNIQSVVPDGSDAKVAGDVVIYPPQSPPSVEEVSETLKPEEKKRKKSGGLVKWILTDSKKKDANATSKKNSVSVAVTNGTAAQKDAKKMGPLSNIYGGISKQKKSAKDDLPEFTVNKLGQPGLDGPVTGVDVTYAVSPPFQYIRIFFDGEELVYNVLEPPLGEGQKKRLETIERSLEKLISSKIVAIKAEEREQFLRDKFEDIIRMYNWTLTEEYKDRMFFYLRKKYLGYDKIEILMKDHYIEDVSCNGPNAYVYIYHRIYGSIRTNISFDDVLLNRFVMRMAQISGKHISILQPIKDISLPDGSRANLTLGTEVTKKGATFTIRKFKERPISPVELMEYNSIDSRALAFLWTLLDYKRSVLVSGGTASGKTTLMNVLCSFIKPELKIVSLEDTPELNLAHPNWIQSVTRSGFGADGGGGGSASGVSGLSAPGKSPGDIGLYDLLVAALRQRPEYILVGEVRGAEAFTLFQAIAVGHAAMGTIHAGTMRELLSRVESNPMNVPRTLFASMDAVCFSALVRRGDRNVRRVLQIVEILELDTDGNLVTNPVFKWDAFNDKFVFSGKSHIFEKIEGQLGIKQEALLMEMENRSRFLQGLRSHGIKDYYEVVERIREYELNKLTSDQPKK